MKQLSLFNNNDSDNEVVNLSVFGEDIKVVDTKEKIEPTLEKQEVSFEVGNYVRTQYDELFKIDGMFQPQKVFVCYEKARNRYAEEYRKAVYKYYERAYAYILNDYGKEVKYYIRQEDVVMQSKFKIDLIFKGDIIKTREYGIQQVKHKEIGKVIEIEEFKNGIRTYVPFTKTYLICGKSLKIMEKDIVSIVSTKSKPTEFLEDGCLVKTRLGKWYTVHKVMSKKVLIKNGNTGKFFFLPFEDIVKVKNNEK